MRCLSYSLFFKSLSSLAKLEKFFIEFPGILKKNYLTNKRKMIKSHSDLGLLRREPMINLFDEVISNIKTILKNNEDISNVININEVNMLFPEKEEKENQMMNANISKLKNFNQKLKLYLDFLSINQTENIANDNDFYKMKKELDNFNKYNFECSKIINENLIPLIKENYIVYEYKFKFLLEKNKLLSLKLNDLVVKLISQYNGIMEEEKDYYNITSELNVYQYEHEKIFNSNNKEIEILGVSDIVDNLFYEISNENYDLTKGDKNRVEAENQMDVDDNAEINPVSIETLFESISILEELTVKINYNLTENFELTEELNVQLIRKLFLTLKNLIDLIYSLFKLTNLSVSIFYNLSVNGFCQEDKYKNSSSSNQEGGVFEGGMGMTDGQGVEDISKEIEDEEQLLGLKDDNKDSINKNNQNKNEKKDKKSGFEVKTDFNEDEKMEFSENDEEEVESDDNSNVEREKDKVDNGDDNKMYDKDNEIKDDNDKKDDKNKEENSKVDLTDKNVEMQDNQDDNDYKAKDQEQLESKRNKKGKEVDKPEDNSNEQNDNNQNEEQDKNINSDKKNEKEKVEKLDIDDSDDEQNNKNNKSEEENKNREEEKLNNEEGKEEIDDPDGNKENSENGEKKENNNDIVEQLNKEMEEDNNKTNDEKGKEIDKETEDDPLENFGKDGEDLFGDGPVNENEQDNNMEIDENGVEQNPSELEDHNENKDDMQDKGFEEEKSIDELVKENEQESLFKSNPLPTEKGDLGYNPISNKQGSKGNTAQESQNKDKEAEIKKEETQQDNMNKDDIEDNNINNVDKYQEAFDLNAMMESVWLSRPSQKKQNKHNKQYNFNPGQNKNAINNLNNLKDDQKENIKENFDFKDYNDEENNENSNNNNDAKMDFDTGFAENMQNQSNKDKNTYAKGFDKKRNEKQNPQENLINETNKNNLNSKSEEENENENNNLNNDSQKINRDQIKNDLTEQADKDNKNDNKQENEDISPEMEIEDQVSYLENEENIQKEKEEEIMNIDDYFKLNMNNEIKREKNENKVVLDENNQIVDENNLDDEKGEKEEGICIEDLKQRESDMMQDFHAWLSCNSNNDMDFNLQLWNKLEQLSVNHINKLTEQLKIVFEPNKQTKLRGNYKSGKRLNIKKIISFIASNYRNDKIWLRRTLPHERNYYVMLAIDDSLSMKEHNLGFFAMESLVIVSTALNKV